MRFASAALEGSLTLFAWMALSNNYPEDTSLEIGTQSLFPSLVCHPIWWQSELQSQNIEISESGGKQWS